MELVSVCEAARRGPLSRYDLTRLRDNGHLPGVLIGKRFRVDYDALLQELAMASTKKLMETENKHE